ncbi:MAG: GDSL-type esterase/lipase family protein, partial [Myxococcota bacterium]|nr:GDSL-type esterase/lipase family protein [Myxococcota bacterium]
AYAALDVPPGAHRVEVRAHGDGRARIFGVLLESERPGVIVESFGVPGARARDQLPWDEATMRAHLARRPVDLYALAYGTNETGDRTPLPTLERDLREVLSRWRDAAPDAACLVIGPSDWPRTRAGELEPRPRTTTVRDLYRRVALSSGCGFFDLLAFQGGPGGIARWVGAGWALGDFVHMTDTGHERLAQVLERALLRGMPSGETTTEPARR